MSRRSSCSCSSGAWWLRRSWLESLRGRVPGPSTYAPTRLWLWVRTCGRVDPHGSRRDTTFGDQDCRGRKAAVVTLRGTSVVGLDLPSHLPCGQDGVDEVVHLVGV